MRVYLASPTGFTPEHKSYRDAVKAKLTSLGHTVVDPWDHDYSEALKEVEDFGFNERMSYNRWLGRAIGKTNYEDLVSADVVLGILDGTEPDSGTVGEVCYGAGRGKVVYGLRTDFRDSGDMAGIPLNLQVLYFIEQSGGKLFRAIEDIDIPLTFARTSGIVRS